MKRYVSSLKQLRKLAFSRDTYAHETIGQRDEEYYVLKMLGRNDWSDLQINGYEVVWERSHCARMIEHAATYISALPALEWLYFGQILCVSLRILQLALEPLSQLCRTAAIAGHYLDKFLVEGLIEAYDCEDASALGGYLSCVSRKSRRNNSSSKK